MSARPQVPEIQLDAEKLATMIPVYAEAVMWMAIVGHIDLALRHPQNTGPSAEKVRGFCCALIEKLVREGVFSREQALLLWPEICGLKARRA